VGGGGPRLEQSRLPRARLELGCASGDPVQEKRSPGGLSGVGLQQSQPRGAALGAAERLARDGDPLGEDSLKLHGRPLPRRRSRLAQALTGPSTTIAFYLDGGSERRRLWLGAVVATATRP